MQNIIGLWRCIGAEPIIFGSDFSGHFSGLNNIHSQEVWMKCSCSLGSSREDGISLWLQRQSVESWRRKIVGVQCRMRNVFINWHPIDLPFTRCHNSSSFGPSSVHSAVCIVKIIFQTFKSPKFSLHQWLKNMWFRLKSKVCCPHGSQ